MSIAKATSERLSTFSDGVFAVLITILVLELHPPHEATFSALGALWPTWLSYAVSYLFVAIVWTNHHFLLRYASEAKPRLIWFNFAHLFAVSLVPFSTAWMAVSELAPKAVAFYAGVFFLVNATYILLIWELVDPDVHGRGALGARHRMQAGGHHMGIVRTRGAHRAVAAARRTRDLLRLFDLVSQAGGAAGTQGGVTSTPACTGGRDAGARRARASDPAAIAAPNRAVEATTIA